MKFNSFDYINKSIDQTKALLWPFKWGTWLKLGLVSFLSGNSDSGIRGFVRGLGDGIQSAGKAAVKGHTNTTN